MGVNKHPITLHKYLYTNSDPVNYTDPTGNFGLGSLGTAANIRAKLAAMGGSAGLSAFVSQAIGATIRISGRTVIKSALRTLRQCIRKKNRCGLQFNLLVVGFDNPSMVEHIRSAQTFHTVILTYRKNKKGNRSWYKGRGGCSLALKKPNYQCDEYPFFKTSEGGPRNANSVSLRWVPAHENMSVGGHFGFLARKMKNRDEFVVVTSYSVPTVALPLGKKKK